MPGASNLSAPGNDRYILKAKATVRFPIRGFYPGGASVFSGREDVLPAPPQDKAPHGKRRLPDEQIPL